MLSSFSSSIVANDHTLFFLFFLVFSLRSLNIVTNLYLNSFKYTVLLSWMHQLLNRLLGINPVTNMDQYAAAIDTNNN